MEMKSFRNSVIAAMDEQSISVAELSRRSGLKYDIVRDLKRRENSSTSAENAIAIAKALGTTVEGLLGDGRVLPFAVSEGDPAPEGAKLVPVYDVEASAGYGTLIESEDNIYNLAFDTRFLRQMTPAKPKDLSVIRVKGDSMEPTLLDNDQVLIDMSKRSLDFDGMFVLRYGNALHVKRVGRSAKKRHVRISSDNAQYGSIDVHREELEVVGKVLWYGRKV